MVTLLTSYNSSKNLGKLLNSQMSAYDKFGLGYGDHRYNGILSYENEVLQSVFKGKQSDFENPLLNERIVKTGEMHAVPPPMTGNYMPSGPEIEVDYSQFTYGPKQTQPSESESQSSEFDTCESNISTEPSELVSEPVVNESNVECQPKVWSDAPIIEEYESDSEDEYVSIPTKQQETPSFANQQVKTPRENVKSQFTHSQKPKVDKKDLGYGFPVRAYCDFHEKRMARKANLNSGWNKKTSQKELRETWNNVQRVNKQNQFVPSAVLTRTGSSTKNFSTVRQSFHRMTVLTNTAMKVNTVKPIDYPHRAQKNKGIIDSGCSRHMTGNKAYLAEFQDFNGGPVAFGGSKGYITGKALVSLLTTITLSTTMAVLDSCPKHNMVAYLEKSEGNTEFHEIIYFLKLSSIHHALTEELKDLRSKKKTNEEAEATSGRMADSQNNGTVVNVSPIPTSRIHSTHPKALILGDPNSAVQTRSKVNTSSGAHAFVSYVQKQKRTNHKDFHHCLFACFLSQHEPKKISEALEDESWVDAMQEELLQFEIQKVWVLVRFALWEEGLSGQVVARNPEEDDLPNGKTASTPIETQKPLSQGEVANDVGCSSLKIVTMLEANLDRKSTTGGCQFLGNDSFLGNARSRPLWLLLLLESE
ncbi:hypothetical protein Tco_0168962 [Tanacetum coccineum]